MHHHDNLFFYHPVYGSAVPKKILILSEPFGSKCLLLGGPHRQGVIARVVQWYERVASLRQVVLCGHGECEVSVMASSKVQYHVCCIPTYKTIYLNKRLSCRLYEDLGYY